MGAVPMYQVSTEISHRSLESFAIDNLLFSGGYLLQTQFWDTSPPVGPTDSWTLHGLWPDNCDGTYEQYCDPNRQYTDIRGKLQQQSPSTLTYMNTYWKDYQGNDESFWQHECAL